MWITPCGFLVWLLGLWMSRPSGLDSSQSSLRDAMLAVLARMEQAGNELDLKAADQAIQLAG